MRELSNDVWLLEVLPRKVALHTSSHLTPIEAWRNAVSTTSEGRRVSSELPSDTCMRVLGVGRVSSEVQLENWTQVWGWAKFGQRVTHSWGEIAVHTCSDLSKPVQTSEPGHNTVIMYARRAMSFFALLNALILWFYVLSWWKCIF